MAGLQQGERKARPGARRSERATPGRPPRRPLGEEELCSALAGLWSPAASGAVCNRSGSQSFSAPRGRGPASLGRKARGPASLVQLRDLHTPAVFVQTPAGRKADGLGGEAFIVRSDRPQLPVGSVGPHPSCQPHSQIETKEHQKGRGFSAHPSQHCPAGTLKTWQIRGKDVMWKEKSCNSPSIPSPTAEVTFSLTEA